MLKRLKCTNRKTKTITLYLKMYDSILKNQKVQ